MSTPNSLAKKLSRKNMCTCTRYLYRNTIKKLNKCNISASVKKGGEAYCEYTIRHDREGPLRLVLLIIK